MITKLVSALGDEDEDVRSNACEALGKIGEKAATNEVITKLMIVRGIHGGMSDEAVFAINGILSSSTLIIGLGPKLISKLCLRKSRLKCLKNVSVNEVFLLFYPFCRLALEDIRELARQVCHRESVRI